MGKGTELDYCDRCGVSIPPEYLRERGGLMLCPECYNEYPQDYRDSADNYEHDLFEKMAERFNPINDPFYDHFHIDDDY